jgi:hypothetical protein
MPLAWLWLEWGADFYVRFLWAVLEPLYDAIGLRPRRGSPVGPRLVSVVPFVVLMAITPGMSGRRRVMGLLLGLLVIASFHLLLFVVVDSAYAVLGQRPRARQGKIVPFLVINDGLPFLVWLFFARDFLRDLIPALREPAKGAPHQGPPGRR